MARFFDSGFSPALQNHKLPIQLDSMPCSPLNSHPFHNVHIWGFCGSAHRKTKETQLKALPCKSGHSPAMVGSYLIMWYCASWAVSQKSGSHRAEAKIVFHQYPYNNRNLWQYWLHGHVRPGVTQTLKLTQVTSNTGSWGSRGADFLQQHKHRLCSPLERWILHWEQENSTCHWNSRLILKHTQSHFRLTENWDL